MNVGTGVLSQDAVDFINRGFRTLDVAGGRMSALDLFDQVSGCAKNLTAGADRLPILLANPPSGVTSFSLNLETHDLAELLTTSKYAYEMVSRGGYDFWLGPARPMLEEHYAAILPHCDVCVYQTQVHQLSDDYAAIVAGHVAQYYAARPATRLWVQVSVNPRGTLLTPAQVLRQVRGLLKLAVAQIDGFWVYYAPDRWPEARRVLSGLIR